MTNAIVPFSFESNTVRIVTDDRGDVWFVAADVCKALDLDNPTKAVSRLDDDERGLTTIQGSPNQVNIINESGLYSLILTSRKEEAKRFKKWVTSEVLPSIRKTGGYAVKPMTTAELSLMHAQMLVDHERELARVKDRLDRIEAQQAVATNSTTHFTVLGYCKYKGLPAPTLNEAQQYGKKAKQLSTQQGLHIGWATDPRFGTVCTYDEQILDVLFEFSERE